MTCFGCKYITEEFCGDGSISYGCELSPGLVTGEHSAFFDDDEPQRCDKYDQDNTISSESKGIKNEV